MEDLTSTYQKGKTEIYNSGASQPDLINVDGKKVYSFAFKTAVALTILKEESTLKEVSKDLGIPRFIIKKWIKEFLKQYKPDISLK